VDHALSRPAVLAALALCCWGSATACAGELSVSLTGSGSDAVTLVGAVQRWDSDGNPRVPVDPKAKIDAPGVDASAIRDGSGRWVFRDLAAGRYDLVVIRSDKIRIEGFHYPPIQEFDPFWPSSTPPPEEETAVFVIKDIASARHYENKVSPLFLAGNEPGNEVRVLVQLVRDLPTSFDAEYGAPVATARHEVWRYANRYGGWVKDRSTRVLDRVLMARTEWERWTWVWEPKLGGIVVGATPVQVKLTIPGQFDPKLARGWFPKSALQPR
jgi:hypothetical protein